MKKKKEKELDPPYEEKEKEFYRCVEQVFHLVKLLHVLSIIDWRTLLSAETYLYKWLIMWFSFLPLRNCSLVTISVILSYASGLLYLKFVR